MCSRATHGQTRCSALFTMTRHRRGEEDELKARLTGYDYGSNSNLVLQSDQPRSKTSKEPTGEAESLKGKMKFGFGDQVQSAKPPTLEREKKKETKKRTTNDEGFEDQNRKPTKKTKVGSVLDADEMDGIKYQPRTRETRQQYEALLHFVRQKLGDQPQSVIMSASDEVLAILKDEEIKPKEKQGLLEDLLNTLTQDHVAELFKISNAITDYTDEALGDDDEVAAVVFGEEESDEDGVLDVEGDGTRLDCDWID